LIDKQTSSKNLTKYVDVNALLSNIHMAGDKTAYLVTDLTVTAMTVIKKRSGSFGQYLSCSKHNFFGIHGLIVRDSYIINKQELKSFICHAAHYSYDRDTY